MIWQSCSIVTILWHRTLDWKNGHNNDLNAFTAFDIIYYGGKGIL